MYHLIYNIQKLFIQKTYSVTSKIWTHDRQKSTNFGSFQNLEVGYHLDQYKWDQENSLYFRRFRILNGPDCIYFWVIYQIVYHDLELKYVAIIHQGRRSKVVLNVLSDILCWVHHNKVLFCLWKKEQSNMLRLGYVSKWSLIFS